MRWLAQCCIGPRRAAPDSLRSIPDCKASRAANEDRAILTYKGSPHGSQSINKIKKDPELVKLDISHHAHHGCAGGLPSAPHPPTSRSSLPQRLDYLQRF
jgi:hypothetical protein